MRNPIKDEHGVEIDGHRIMVRGATGPVHATWTLAVDDQELDSAKAAGDFTLRGELPEGTPVEAQVHQSLIGPTDITILRDGDEVGTSRGFVL